jgi:hypothetical protein
MDQDFFHSHLWTNWPMTWKVGQHINSACFFITTCFNPIEKIEEILHFEPPSVGRKSIDIQWKEGGGVKSKSCQDRLLSVVCYLKHFLFL